MAGYSNVDDWALDESGGAVIFGAVLLLVGGWWLASGNSGPALQGIAMPTVVAAATPLLLTPVYLTTSAPGFVAVAVLIPLALLPLADGLSTAIAGDVERGRTRILAAATAVCALLAGLAVLTQGRYDSGSFGFGIFAAATTLVPGLVASSPAFSSRLASGGSPSGRIVESIEYLAVGATPAVAVFSLLYAPGSALVPLVWILALLLAQRLTVRPLARLATRATLQRDLVVAATEAERARIATDLHDVALQDLTLLVRQLDARGDAESAEAARRVVEQLRTITGELRLPILDDLGVGPALEWLVSRMERIAGGEVRLERDDGTRLPPDVELAFFRVAQEALANAVKHGEPPIVVRYRVSPGGAALTIDDAGPGIVPGAAEAAPAAGHFGLLGMQQRAEQIGALLDIRRWPSGGTHVALEWRAR